MIEGNKNEERREMIYDDLIQCENNLEHFPGMEW